MKFGKNILHQKCYLKVFNWFYKTCMIYIHILIFEESLLLIEISSYDTDKMTGF